MSINLVKGQKIDLTKSNPGLSKIFVGLGWDPASKGGFFGGKHKIDCDASAILLTADGRFSKESNIIYFGNLKSPCGSVQHTGDNLTGDGDGDDECVLVDLSKVPTDVDKIVFVVNIYDCVSRKQDFGLVEKAYIRVVNATNNKEVIKFNLSENYSGRTALLVGEIYRNSGEWKFSALGEGTNDSSLGELVRRYK